MPASQERSATRTVLRPDVEAGGRGVQAAVSFDLPDHFRGHCMRAAVELVAGRLEFPFPLGCPLSQADDAFKDRFSNLDRDPGATLPQATFHASTVGRPTTAGSGLAA